MNHLKELRTKKGLTFKELSQELAKQNIKIAPDTLAKYERGERNPKIDKLEALSEFYNVSVSYLQGKAIPIKVIIHELNYCWLDNSSFHGTDEYSSHEIIKMYLELYDIKQQPIAKTKEDFRADNINYWKKHFAFVFDEIHKKELQGNLYSYQTSLIDSVIYNSIAYKINHFNNNSKIQLNDSLKEYEAVVKLVIDSNKEKYYESKDALKIIEDIENQVNNNNLDLIKYIRNQWIHGNNDLIIIYKNYLLDNRAKTNNKILGDKLKEYLLKNATLRMSLDDAGFMNMIHQRQGNEDIHVSLSMYREYLSNQLNN